VSRPLPPEAEVQGRPHLAAADDDVERVVDALADLLLAALDAEAKTATEECGR
jgi:hypothetical protein